MTFDFSFFYCYYLHITPYLYGRVSLEMINTPRIPLVKENRGHSKYKLPGPTIASQAACLIPSLFLVNSGINDPGYPLAKGVNGKELPLNAYDDGGKKGKEKNTEKKKKELSKERK